MSETIEHGALTIISADKVPALLAADKAGIFSNLLRELEGFEPDVTTKKGREEIASKARKVAVAKMDFVRLAAALKEDHQKTIKNINSEVRVLEERMDALKAEIRKPLDDFEAREEARVEAHKAALREVEAWGMLPADASVADIRQRLENPPRDLVGRDWQEFLEPAQRASRNAANALKVALADAEAAVAAAAAEAARQAEEAERQRQEAERAQQEREAEIARQAAENARMQAEREAQERAAQAERAAQVERDRIAQQAREAQEAADRAEAERAAAEERAKAAEARREADRIARHQNALRLMQEAALGASAMSPSIDARLDRLEEIWLRQWDEFGEQARDVYTASQTELLRQRGIAVEAEQKAQAERDERARQAAVDAERQRVEREAAKQRAEQDARERNQAHRRKINRAAADAIVLAMSEAHAGTAEEAAAIAQAIVIAIAKGAVPNVTISY